MTVVPNRPKRWNGGMVRQPQVRFGIAGGVLFSALLVVVHVPSSYGVLLMLLLTVLFSIGLGHRLATALGVSGWALSDGFALNRLGVLTFTPTALALLIIFAGGAWLVGRQ